MLHKVDLMFPNISGLLQGNRDWFQHRYTMFQSGRKQAFVVQSSLESANASKFIFQVGLSPNLSFVRFAVDRADFIDKIHCIGGAKFPAYKKWVITFSKLIIFAPPDFIVFFFSLIWQISRRISSGIQLIRFC